MGVREAKITACKIGSYPRAKVVVTFDDGSTKELFTFYSDELSFSEQEFVGLTEKQAHALHYQRDVAYLRA